MDPILILGTIQGATGMLVKHGVIRTLVYLFEHVCKSIVYNYTPVRQPHPGKSVLSLGIKEFAQKK